MRPSIATNQPDSALWHSDRAVEAIRHQEDVGLAAHLLSCPDRPRPSPPAASHSVRSGAVLFLAYVLGRASVLNSLTH